MEESTIAWNVPWISEATKEGKSIALSVARVTSPTRPVAVGGDADGAAGAPGAGAGTGAPTVEGCGAAGEDELAGGVRREARSLPASCEAYGASGFSARYSAMRDIE